MIHALEQLQASGELSAEEDARATELFAWFNINLPAPTRFARAGRAHASKVALSWFKDGATDCIDRMREVAAILGAHDIGTEMLRTQRPGFVVYEDELQVVAEPFADTPT